MTFLGEGATGFTSLSGSEMSAFFISLRRYPVKKKKDYSETEKSVIKVCKYYVEMCENHSNRVQIVSVSI